MANGGRTHPHVHFHRPPLSDQANYVGSGGAPHDAVVDHPTTRFPLMTSGRGLNLSLTPRSRSRWAGSMKVRPTYLFLISPSL